MYIALLFREIPQSAWNKDCLNTMDWCSFREGCVFHWNKKPSEKMAGQPLVGFNSAFKLQSLFCFSLVAFQFRYHGVFILQNKQVNNFKFEKNQANRHSQWYECKFLPVSVDKAVRFVRTGQKTKGSASQSFSTPSDHLHCMAMRCSPAAEQSSQFWTGAYCLSVSSFFLSALSIPIVM